MIEILLGILAVELGIVVIALVSGVYMEIVNNTYIRRCHAEAQAEAKRAMANNPFAQMGNAAANQGAGTSVPVAPCSESCGDCKSTDGKPCEDCKDKGPGQYMSGGNYI